MTTTDKRILCIGTWTVGNDEPVIITGFSAEFLDECAEEWPEVDARWEDEPGHAEAQPSIQ